MKPRIAIPQAHSGESEYVRRVMPQYFEAVRLGGGEPVEVPLNADNHEIARLATTCEAVLLPGSHADVNPEKYDQPRHRKTNPPDPLRDNVDELLLQDAYNMRKPVLGICFGMQILNVWRTGTLIQDISSGVDHVVRGIPRAHTVVIDPISRLAAIVAEAMGQKDAVAAGRTLQITVNSSHHQAAGLPGDGLRVVARCPVDNMIEALEGTASGHFVLGVQWHPERMLDDPAAIAIFRALVEAAKERRLHPRTSNPDFESLSQ